MQLFKENTENKISLMKKKHRTNFVFMVKMISFIMMQGIDLLDNKLTIYVSTFRSKKGKDVMPIVNIMVSKYKNCTTINKLWNKHKWVVEYFCDVSDSVTETEHNPRLVKQAARKLDYIDRLTFNGKF